MDSIASASQHHFKVFVTITYTTCTTPAGLPDGSSPTASVRQSVRRFSAPHGTTLAQFRALCEALLAPMPEGCYVLAVSYKDSDGDVVEVGSEMEWAEALVQQGQAHSTLPPTSTVTIPLKVDVLVTSTSHSSPSYDYNDALVGGSSVNTSAVWPSAFAMSAAQHPPTSTTTTTSIAAASAANVDVGAVTLPQLPILEEATTEEAKEIPAPATTNSANDHSAAAAVNPNPTDASTFDMMEDVVPTATAAAEEKSKIVSVEAPSVTEGASGDETTAEEEKKQAEVTAEPLTAATAAPAGSTTAVAPTEEPAGVEVIDVDAEEVKEEEKHSSQSAPRQPTPTTVASLTPDRARCGNHRTLADLDIDTHPSTIVVSHTAGFHVVDHRSAQSANSLAEAHPLARPRYSQWPSFHPIDSPMISLLSCLLDCDASVELLDPHRRVNFGSLVRRTIDPFCTNDSSSASVATAPTRCGRTVSNDNDAAPRMVVPSLAATTAYPTPLPADGAAFPCTSPRCMEGFLRIELFPSLIRTNVAVKATRRLASALAKTRALSSFPSRSTASSSSSSSSPPAATTTTAAEDALAALELLACAIQVFPADSTLHYHYTCALSLSAQLNPSQPSAATAAVAQLRTTLQKGYEDTQQLLTDPMLEYIRGTPTFTRALEDHYGTKVANIIAVYPSFTVQEVRLALSQNRDNVNAAAVALLDKHGA